MSNPADQPTAWTAPGGSGEQRRDDEPGGWQPPAQPPAQPTGWGAPQVPPAWTGQPPAPGGWGSPQVPQGWGGAGLPPQPPMGPGYGYPPAPQPWAPPVLQPGIIPLRPLSLGEILDGGVKAIRANPKVMFGLSSAAVAVAVLISAVLSYYVSGLLAGTVNDLFSGSTASLPPAESAQFSDNLSVAYGALATTPITSLVTTILTGLLVVSVSRSVLGHTISVREVLRSRRVWWVVGFSLLAGLGIVVGAGVLVGLVALLAVTHHVGAAIAVGLLSFVGFIVFAVWFNTRTLLVTPALMLEGKGFWATVARAWRLTRGSFWRLFGIWLLVSVLMGVLQNIIGAPFLVISTIASSGTAETPLSVLITSIGQVIALTATTTYTAAVVALLYIDVRMRREGLDIELGRAATADAAGAVR